MLSFKNGKKIANVGNKQSIFLKDEEDEAEIDTTDENKKKLFVHFLELDKKMSPSDISILVDCFEKDESPPKKFERKFRDSKIAVEKSLKKNLVFQKESIFPIIDEPSYRMFISGLSGSGKSTFISEFLKNNPKKNIFLFSPVQNDKSLAAIKNLVHLSIEEFEENVERDIEIEDFPKKSVVIFDDIESFKKNVVKQYTELRDILLERGRHHDISTICVSHNATNGNTTKVSIREAQYWILFPKFNSRDSKNILKIYGGLETNEINQILRIKSRWVLYKKTIPKYAIGEKEVILFD